MGSHAGGGGMEFGNLEFELYLKSGEPTVASEIDFLCTYFGGKTLHIKKKKSHLASKVETPAFPSYPPTPPKKNMLTELGRVCSSMGAWKKKHQVRSGGGGINKLRLEGN